MANERSRKILFYKNNKYCAERAKNYAKKYFGFFIRKYSLTSSGKEFPILYILKNCHRLSFNILQSFPFVISCPKKNVPDPTIGHYDHIDFRKQTNL